MCGIFCSIAKCSEHVSPSNAVNNRIYELCKPYISTRGPDCFDTKHYDANNWTVFLAGSVLSLRGPVTKQPCETTLSLFLYNGDVFGGSLLNNEEVSEEGDTVLLQRELDQSENIVDTLQRVEGPFSFIYVDKRKSKVYFGRDFFGRRSLLVSYHNDKITLSSVIPKNVCKCIELPAIGVFSFNLNNNNLKLSLHSWKNVQQNLTDKLHDLDVFFNSIEICSPTESLIHTCKLTTEILFNETLSHNILLKTLETDALWSKNYTHLLLLLRKAVKKRIQTQPPFCKNCIPTREICTHVKTGVLFSGGLDCAVLSLLADDYVEPSDAIDLLNVAFEHKNGFNTPDRLSAEQTYDELCKLRPNRKWNLVKINITQEELRVKRETHICHLIHPLNTILDESLGCAMWFASRGSMGNYTSACRVLLVGTGADELFGGYKRHRSAFVHGGWERLSQELDTDWRNISHRNLARDDRVISDHGRQVRTPYLDENVVEFVRSLPAWEKCCPAQNLEGSGDKLLLRLMARHIGLQGASVLKKRALQFGSRIANSKENAYDISPRL